MVLSIYIGNVSIRLKEVVDEAEAFSEMGRYLEVNNIYSDTTSLTRWSGERESEAKLVWMGTNDKMYGNDFLFGIHTETPPRYDTMKDALAGDRMLAYYYAECNDGSAGAISSTNSLRHKVYRLGDFQEAFLSSSLREHCPPTPVYPTGYLCETQSFRYDEYDRYMQDLQRRMSETCH